MTPTQLPSNDVLALVEGRSRLGFPDPMTLPYTFIETTEEACAVVEKLAAADLIAIDTETEVIDGPRSAIGPWSVMSISAMFGDEMSTWVIDMTNIDTLALAPGFLKVDAFAWNANFERRVFERAGIYLRRWIDLMLYQAVLDQGTYVARAFYTGLAAAARHWLDVDLEGKGGIQLSFKPGIVLSDEQKAYAAQDAIVTCWLHTPIVGALKAENLFETAEREARAQSYIDKMNLYGLPFDAEGWRVHLAESETRANELLEKLADLTGGGELVLFGPVRPSWDPESTLSVKEVLNKYSAEEVAAYQKVWGSGAPTLEREDQVDKTALALIGGDLVKTLLAYRGEQKLITTYGENMLELLGPDDRFHSRYLHCLTNTGRLSSDGPNAQNMSPASKKYTKPADPDRVFICADYSQAELRFLAQITQDAALLDAFRNGADLHVVTAARMFGVDMEDLEVSDPEKYSALRKKAKTLNFGIVYGLGARSLAVRLTVDGVPTSPKEAKELLALYLEVYPQVDAWLASRDAHVKSVSNNPGPIDFVSTWKLLKLYPIYSGAYWKLRKQNRSTSYKAIAEAVLATRTGSANYQADLEAAVQEAAWALSFKGPGVLKDSTTPFTFESRTPGGRRRLFQVTADEWLTSMMLQAGSSKKPRPSEVRAAWSKEHGVDLLGKNGKPLGYAQLKKRFEKKDLKLSFVQHVLTNMPDAAEYLQTAALADCIRAKVNEYRNHPIQGGVGDAVLDAFARLEERLSAYTDAWGVQSVHDSIVIECNRSDAQELATVVQETMVSAMEAYCPDLPVKVDVDVQGSLDAKTDTIAFELEDLLAV